MEYLKNILLLLFIFVVFNIQGQQIIGHNLVQNPSFENYSSCPSSSGELTKATNWWGFSCDYYNSCATQLSVSVPFNFCGFQNAKSGNAYTGFEIYWHTPNMANNFTIIESIKNELYIRLKKNKYYCINYFISLTNQSILYASATNCPIIYDSIGAIFSVNQVPDNNNIIICDSCPKFSQSIANIDTTNWLKISGSVIAKGDEKYLTIGKFNYMNWTNGNYCQVSVYLDDVSVCECSFEFSLGKDTTLCEGETLRLNPNLPNAIYTWQDSSHAATYTVTRPGTYWVRAYFPDYGITTSASINVTYDGACLKIPNVITPNNDGKNDYFVIENSEGWNIDVQIFNRWGAIVYQNNTYKNTWDGKEVADGVYYYFIKATNITNGFEKNYKGSVTILR